MENRYDRQKQLGAGVTGEVWLATDTMLRREVAIKYLHAVDDEVHRGLFVDEARMLARLHHQGITTLFDAALDDSGYYLVMEFVEGRSLREFIETEDYDLKSALNIGINILEALRYAHTQGVIHRDIKPENVLITADGTVKLTDFGFANLVSILRKGSDYQIGTPAYMPPEQALGRATDERSDLYAFGVMLYELITGGTLPFEESDEPIVIARTPDSVRKHLPDVPLGLEHTLNRLLSTKPEDRYPSADTLLNVLRPVWARLQYSASHILLLAANDAGVLIGRESQSQALQHAWQQLWVSNRPKTVIVTGEVGVGKTRLIADFLSRVVTTKYPIFIGKAGDDDLPYGPFADIIAALIRRYPNVAGSCSLSQQQLLATFFPGTAELFPPFPKNLPPVPTQPKQAQIELFETYKTMFEQLGPTVIWLEDATRLDESSQALFHFLHRHVQNPMLLIATCRNETISPWWLACQKPLVVEVKPLSESDTAVYLTSLFNAPVDDSATQAIYRRSYGNPLFIDETRQHMIESKELVKNDDGTWVYHRRGRSGSLPPTLINIFQRLLSRLSRSSQQALSVAALLGNDFEFKVWVELLGDQELALDSLDEALGLRLLVDQGNDRYSFTPSNLVNILADSLSSTRRRLTHTSIVEMLKDLSGVEPALLAYHAQSAGLVIEAASYWQHAGCRAAASNALGTAIAAFEAANKLSPSSINYETLGNLYRQQGKAKPAIEALQQALLLADTPAAKARILNSQAFVYWLYDQYQLAYRAARSALDQKDIRPEIRAISLSHLGMIAWLMGKMVQADEHCLTAVKIMRPMLNSRATPTEEKRLLIEALGGAANRLGLVKISLGDFLRAKNAVNMALQLRQRLNDIWGEAFCRVNLAKIAIAENDNETASLQLAQAETLFKRIDSQDGLMVVHTNQGRLLLAQSEPVAAQEVLNQALKLAMDIGKWSAYGLGDIYLLLAEAKMMQREFSQAESALQEALHLVETAGNTEYVALGLALRSQLHLRQGQLEEANQSRAKAMRTAQETGSDYLLQRVVETTKETVHA